MPRRWAVAPYESEKSCDKSRGKDRLIAASGNFLLRYFKSGPSLFAPGTRKDSLCYIPSSRPASTLKARKHKTCVPRTFARRRAYPYRILTRGTLLLGTSRDFLISAGLPGPYKCFLTATSLLSSSSLVTWLKQYQHLEYWIRPTALFLLSNGR